MRLINSDGQVCDAKVVAHAGGNANRNSVTMVDSRWAVVALGFAIASFAISGAVAFYAIGREIEAQLKIANIQAEASRDIGIEKRLNTQAIDELKLEMRAALKNRDTRDTHELK